MVKIGIGENKFFVSFVNFIFIYNLYVKILYC